MSAPSDPDDVLDLVRACASGDSGARRTFQDRYGEDIYNFPVKIYRVPPDLAADFYVYVFERDRIFTRLRTFEGRNRIQFRTFLAYYLLRSLFLEWQRGRRELETVPLGDGDSALPDDAPAHAAADGPAARVWTTLDPEDRLDLKLLSLLEHQLTADDLRLLARMSRRSLADTAAVVAEVEAGLRARDVALSRLREQLDSAWGWIVLRRRELQEIDAKLHLLRADHDDSAAGRQLRDRRRRLEETLARRIRQRDGLLDEVRSFKMTTPYKDIARLRNSTVGTVCSRVFRLRQRLERQWQSEEAVS
jgi:RNA polymerase sigma factor (sigma-70 family)